jgi:hypothetical protein
MEAHADSHSVAGTHSASHTRPYVLAFVGENENGILRWWTEQVLTTFAARGLSCKVIDLRKPEWRADLTTCLAIGKPEFCFSFQGMGMTMPLPSGENLWQRLGVPFLSCLGDNPYHAPAHHTAEGSGNFLLYGCEDFLQTYRRFMNGRAVAGILSTGYPPNPLADRTPWSKRKLDIVFVKTGVDPEKMSAEWNAWPRKAREILHDCAARVLSGADETVAVLCAEVFADRQIYWGDRRELFLSTCSMVDRYARAVRAQRMVTALMRHNAVIVGNWPHLDKLNSRAVFQSPIAAEDLNAMYADSRITVNTLPTVRFGMHERIMAGLFAKTVVVSENTPHLQQRLSQCPSFFGLDIDSDTFVDQLDETLRSSLANPRSAEDVEVSAQVAQRLFSFDDFVNQLLEYIALERYCSALKWWASPPAIN